jgi:glutamate-1-semialdehyde 2,1-aminomutase
MTQTPGTTDVTREPPTALAGGVSASMRFYPYLGHPFLTSRGDGPYIYDEDGNSYVDFNTSNGAAILGHNHPAIRDAVISALNAGTIAAAETRHHELLARTLCEIIPSAERVRFASTGSEVTAVAVRLARHVTGRRKILKFDGHFHGLTDTFLYRPDESDGRSIVPASGGVSPLGATEVVMVPWNAPESFAAAIDENRDELAAVILEPVHYNAGCIPPVEGLLELIRSKTAEYGVVLIFDEVLSGFRVALGGMEEFYGVRPDLSTWAKALANGMPLSALTGKAELMEQLAPMGPVAHSGTYSGHLHSVLAASATIQRLRQPGVFDQVRETSNWFYRNLQEIFDRNQLPVRVQGLGTRFGLYFGRTEPVTSVADVQDHDHDLNRRFYLGCLKRGVYFHAYTGTGPPGHAGFSLAHSDDVLQNALEVMDSVAAEIARGSDV